MVTEPKKAPNIVIVLADDLGWGDLSCYGATRIQTPNIDRLAAEGIRFEDAHSASAVCTPSRYALLTGRYCWRSPLKRGVLMGHGPALIEADRPTMASVLKSTGYRTAAIGKWHLGLGWQHRDGTIWSAFNEDDPLEYQLGDPLKKHHDRDIDFGESVDYSKPFTGGPRSLGFDRFFGIAGSLNMPPYAYLREDRTERVPDQPKRSFLPSQRGGFQAAGWNEQEVDIRFTEEAVDFIDEQSGSSDPFLLYFAPSAPHRPQVPPDFLRGSSGAGPRGDAVTFVDWMTGQLLGALEKAGKLDDTLFIFTSDNGAPTIFADDGDLTVHKPNGPWRGQKGDLWDGGHREPLVMRWPDRIPAGARSSVPVGLIDLLPSLAAMAGIDLPKGAAPDGVDRSAILMGGEEGGSRPLVYHSMGGAYSVRDGRWKAIFTTGSGGGLSTPAGMRTSRTDPSGQLFDLEADPTEEHDLWNDNPTVVAELYAQLRTICQDPANGLPFDLPFEEPRPAVAPDEDELSSKHA